MGAFVARGESRAAASALMAVGALASLRLWSSRLTRQSAEGTNQCQSTNMETPGPQNPGAN